jgi:hypothetical protein
VGQCLRLGSHTCTHWIGGDASSLTENIHGVIEVIFKGRANSQSNIAEALQDRDFGITVQGIALQVLRQQLHKAGGVFLGLFAQRTGDVSNDSDGDHAELAVLVCLEGWEQELKECGDVWLEVLFQRRSKGSNDKESILQHGRNLSNQRDQLQNQGHDPVSVWLDVMTELANDTLCVTVNNRKPLLYLRNSQ